MDITEGNEQFPIKDQVSSLVKTRLKNVPVPVPFLITLKIKLLETLLKVTPATVYSIIISSK
jgi:hypothetical protein